MKSTILSLSFTILICTLTLAQTNDAAPKIISTLPDFGDCNVDSGLTQVTIRFDQDMASSMNMKNTQNMPEITGRPKWTDLRTLIIPVKLHSNKLYTLAFNNSATPKFANTSGRLLNPEELHFQTTSISTETLNKLKSLNQKAFNELMDFFPKQYSYARLRGIDWTAVLMMHRAEFENAKTNTEFALKLVKLLRLAGDPHLSIGVDGHVFYTSMLKNVEYNFDLKQRFTFLQNKKEDKDTKSVAGVIDSVGYISINTWRKDYKNLTYEKTGDSTGQNISAIEVLKELFRYPNLIVDVRANSGGNEAFAQEFASYFIKESTPYQKTKTYNEKTGLFDLENVFTIYPDKNLTYTGKVYVLSGPSVFSSNESFILMMKQAPNADVVGMKTYGGSGNPRSHTLQNGVIVNLPSWQAYSLDDKLIEGNGIEPDIEIKTSKSDFETKDVLIEDVIKMINK